MKTKMEKVLHLITINHNISNERAKEIGNKWTCKGLDLLQVLWHTYYNTTAHEVISTLLLMYKEKELNLNYLEKVLKEIK